jgi:hypothetical protein
VENVGSELAVAQFQDRALALNENRELVKITWWYNFICLTK